MSLIGKIGKNLVEGRLLQVTFRAIGQGICRAVNGVRWRIDKLLSMPARAILCKNTPVDPHKVMFMTFNNEYMCNQKYICEELLRRKLPLDLVWAVTEKQKRRGGYPKGVRLVVRGSYEFFKEMTSAKVWIDNALCFVWDPVRKKDGQFYLQTWHGSMGLKRIGKEDVKDRKWISAAERAGKWTDVIVSDSTFETGVFRETHWPETKVLELGHARNDIFFKSEKEKAEIDARVRKWFGLGENTKVALYAPTFRAGDADDTYDLDHERFLDALEKRFGGEWALLNRYHFKTKAARKNGADKGKERILSATDYPDIQELMVAADAGVTDYSSWICDFILTGRPGFIYAPDLASYDKERGFYYPLEELPYPVAETNDELEEKVLAFDEAGCPERCRAFLKARGCCEQGTASAKIADMIEEKCGLAQEAVRL